MRTGLFTLDLAAREEKTLDSERDTQTITCTLRWIHVITLFTCENGFHSHVFTSLLCLRIHLVKLADVKSNAEFTEDRAGCSSLVWSHECDSSRLYNQE